MRIFEELITIEGNVRKDDPLSYREAKAKFEKMYLDHLLKWSKGNVKRAAQRAGRDRKGLYVLMEKYGIDPMDFRKNRNHNNH